MTMQEAGVARGNLVEFPKIRHITQSEEELKMTFFLLVCSVLLWQREGAAYVACMSL